jgi:Flp pilus assembly protein CpaB
MQAVETMVPRAVAKARRLDLRVIIGLALMAISLVGVTAVVRRAEARVPVLVAAQPIEAGSVIEATDLRVESLSISGGIAHLSESDRASTIGSFAAQRLSAGQLLTQDSVLKTTGLPAGYVAMSLALKPDRAAGGELRPGDHVAVIASSSPDQPERGTRILLQEVPVLSLRQSDRADGGLVIVSLRLRLEEARDLAEAKEAGAIDLVLLSGERS